MKLHASARGPVSCRRFTPVANGLIYDSILRYAMRWRTPLFFVCSGNINGRYTFLRHDETDEEMNMAIEIPSDDQVVEALELLGNGVTARALCVALINAGHPLRQSQVAIQRAAERGRITVHDDWTLSVPNAALAA